MPRRTTTIVALVLGAALVALLVYGVAGTGDDTTLDDALARGERPVAPAADLRRPLVDGGGERALADLRGKVVVLNLWASWCDPCRKETPVLNAAHQRLTRSGAGLVTGATIQDATVDSQAFERELGIRFDSVRDVDTRLAEAFGYRGVPETYVLDREGRLVAVRRGPIDQAFVDAALRKAGVS